AQSVGIDRQATERVERLHEPVRRFQRRGPVERLVARLTKIGDGLAPGLGTGGMMRETLDLFTEASGVEPLDRLGDTRMQCFAPFGDDAVVSDIVRERVAEGVLDVRKESRLIEKLVGLQPGQRAAEVGGVPVAYLAQQRERDVEANHRRVEQEAL